MTTIQQSPKSMIRDLVAFWIFGLANNYGYVIMLSAAEDIVAKEWDQEHKHDNSSSICKERIESRQCTTLSTGTVLLADIIPTLVVKLTFPFFMHRLPFGMRHFIICTTQAISFLIVAFAWNFELSLIGAMFASFSSGLGEICYLALTAHYSKTTIMTWSSGTGGAGLVGAAAYAILTEPYFANLSPRSALLVMLIVPLIFAFTYWCLLTPVPTIYRMDLTKPNTWIVPISYIRSEESKGTKSVDDVDRNNSTNPSPGLTKTLVKQKAHALPFNKKIILIIPLLKYMIPLGTVYFAEYLINQGIVQLIHFDCSHGFRLSKASQYRWYQVLYQVGVFISRSSVKCLELSRFMLFMLPLLQLLNVFVFFFESLYIFMPHIIIVFMLILFEGFFGGAAYVNTFNRIHKEASPEVKEFSLSVASVGDTIGIVGAGFLAIPLHNYICGRPFPHGVSNF